MKLSSTQIYSQTCHNGHLYNTVTFLNGHAVVLPNAFQVKTTSIRRFDFDLGHI